MNKDKALRLALEVLKNNRRTHHYCEDTWYSCPKHEDGCANDSEGDECNCGADEANTGIDQTITAIKSALEAKGEPDYSICPTCGGMADDPIVSREHRFQSAALEAKDEPVAWMRTSGTGSSVVTEALLVEMPEMRWNFQQPLYTNPSQRKPLTLEQLREHWKVAKVFDMTHAEIDIADYVLIARDVEALHGIKGEE